MPSVSWRLAGGFQIALKFSQFTSFNIKLLSDNLVKAEEINSKSVILDIYLKNVTRFLDFHSFFFFRVQKAVTLINDLDTGRFSRLLSRILQKLHIKVGIESENDPKSFNIIWAASKYMNFNCQNATSSHEGQ